MTELTIKHSSCEHCNNEKKGVSSSHNVSTSKEEFVKSVKRALTLFKEKYGYSHDRATAALLRELSRGDQPPSREEVFQTMNTCGVGIDEAAKAFTISRVLKRGLSEKLSLQEAIDSLTSKLSLSNLIKAENEYQCPGLPKSNSCENVTINHKIRPVATSTQQPSRTSLLSPIVVRKMKSVGNKNGKGKLKNSTNIIRKRTIDEICQTDKRDSPNSFPVRERADSVTTVVNAKIAQKSLRNEEEIAATETPLRAVPGNIRLKRTRGDDTDTPGTLKRVRTNL